MRSRPIELDLPECNGLDDILVAFDVTVAAMAAGEITPDEALTVSRVLDRRRRAIEARARQQAREAKHGRDAVRTAGHDAAAVSPAPEIPAGSDSPDEARLVIDEAAAEPAETSAAAEAPPAPTVASILAQVGADLHSACNYSSRRSSASPVAAAETIGFRGSGFVETAIGPRETPTESGETAGATDAPPRRPLPGFGSACIQPALRRRTPRSAGAIGTGAAAPA